MNHQLLLKNGEEVIIKRLSLIHLEEILSLQFKVIAALSTESFLQPLSIEEFRFILKGKGLMLGAFAGNRLIAFRAMMEPELDDEHLGRDAGIDEVDLQTVLYSEITNVDPDYQGNGLQLILGQMIMQEVDNKRFRIICATVAPFNIPSLKDKFALGMHIVALKEKYGNLLRYILVKDMECPLKKEEFLETRLVEMADTEQQQRLLQQGWLGTELVKKDEEWFVSFLQF